MARQTTKAIGQEDTQSYLENILEKESSQEHQKRNRPRRNISDSQNGDSRRQGSMDWVPESESNSEAQSSLSKGNLINQNRPTVEGSSLAVSARDDIADIICTSRKHGHL